MKVYATLFRTVSLLMMTMIRPCTPGAVAYMEMIFNNGNAPLATQACTAADHRWVDACFAGSGARKLLRTASNTTTVGTSQHPQQDQRQAYPLVCKELCAGCVAKTCRATRCNGYRRDLKDHVNGQYEETYHRDLLLDMGMCNKTIDFANKCVDQIMWMLSTSCRSFYSRNLRKGTCRLFELC